MDNVHFLQSGVWGKFQESLGHSVIAHSTDNWSYVAYSGKDRIGVYYYAPYGPTAVSEASLHEAIEHMKQAARKAGAYELIIEPVAPASLNNLITKYGSRAKSRQPWRHLLIDLNRPEQDILADMKSNRRNEYRNYHKKGIKIRKSYQPSDIDTFIDFLHRSSEKKQFFARDTEFFKTMAEQLLPSKDIVLFVGEVDGKAESIGLFYDDDTTRYYAFLGRDPDARGQASSSPALTAAILDAKEQGKTHFDLFGISDSDDVVDEKTGYTKYKRSFGGEPHEYLGTWEISLNARKRAMKKTLVIMKKLLGKG